MNYFHQQAGCLYEWDTHKARQNSLKHQVSFELACEVFHDPDILSLRDLSENYYGEERWRHLGKVDNCLILLVVTTERKDAVRIISARAALPSEKRAYYKGDARYDYTR